MNKITLLGNMVRDPEMRATTSGKQVASFSIAVSRRFKKGEVDFFNCTVWEKLSETIVQYFKKGQKILIVGRLENRSWEHTDGSKRYATDVIVEEFYFVESKGDSSTEISTGQPDNEFVKIDIENDDSLPF